MKKLYLFIFLIVIGGVLQIQPVNARTNKLLTGKKASTTALPTILLGKAIHKKFIAPPVAPVITFTALGSKVFTDVDIIPSVTTTCTLPIPVTFTSSNTAVATIVNGNIHIVGLGTATIKASQQNSDALTNAPATAVLPADASQTLTVTGPAVLTVTAVGTKLVGSVDFPLVTTAVGLTKVPIVYTSNNPAVATVTNGVVHLTGATGTTVLRASQQNNTNPASANLPATATLPADQFQTLTVTAPLITFASPGIKQFTPADLAPGATSSLPSPPAITYTSSNPTVATITSNGILTISNTSYGNGYTPGTYPNINLTGGLGTGAQATITVMASGQAIARITNMGSGYNIGDLLSFSPASLGTTPASGGSGFAITVVTLTNGLIHFVAAPTAPNNTAIITASQGGGPLGTALLPPDVLQTLTVTPATINFPTLGTRGYSTQDFNPGVSTNAGTTRYVNLTSNNPAVATIINTQSFTLTSGGSLYTNGTYTNVPLVGGTGSGSIATIVVASGSVTTVTFTTVGTNYSNGDLLTCSSTSIGGTGSGFTITLSGYTSVIHYNNNIQTAPNNTATITATMGGGATGTPTLAADVSQVLTVTGPTINFPPLLTKQFTSTDLNPGASGSLIGLPISYTSSNPAVATIVNGLIHFTGAPAAPNNTTVITASQTPVAGVNTGTLTLPAPVPQTLTVTPPTITFAALGTRSLGADFNPGAISTVSNIPVNYTSSNPAVATVVNNVITGGTSTSLGTGYGAANTTLNVPLTGGTGTGAKVSITINATGQAIATLTSGGSGYTVGDVLTFSPASIGITTGSGYTLLVTAIANYLHFVGAPTGNNTTVITATQGGGATGTLTLPADVSQTLTATPPVITFPALGSKQLSTTYLNPGATSTLNGTPITYTSSNTAIATVLTGSITGGFFNPGINFLDGTYTVTLAGGTGTGATAIVTALGGTVTGYTIIGNNSGYTVGDILTAPSSQFGGQGLFFSIRVTATSSVIKVVSAPASPNNTVTITASQGGGATGTATLPADVSQVLTVTAPTITFAQLGTKTYPSTDIFLGSTNVASSTVAQPITFTSNNNAVASINLVAPGPGVVQPGYYLHIAGAPAAPNNTATITASQGGGAAGTAALPADVSQVVTTVFIPVTFTFPPLGTVALTNVDINPGIVSPLAGVPITYSSSNTAVATIVNGKIHMTGVGTATITVSQGGGAAGTLTIPPDASQTITVTAPTLVFPAIGTRQYSNVDFNPGATSSITNIPVTYTSSNTAIATVNTTLLLSTPIAGSGYKNGTYTNVPLTGGTGSGAQATIVVQNGSVASVTPTATGKLYTPGDILSCQALSIGGTGNGFNTTVLSYYSLIHINANVPAAPNNTVTITASLGGGAAGTAALPADASQVLTVIPPTITFAALGTKPYSPLDFTPGATSPLSTPTITYTSSNTAVATITNTLVLGKVTGGSLYTNGTYTNVPLTATTGTGTGATATIVVANNSVSTVTVTLPGQYYTTGDLLSCAVTSIGGGPGTGFTIPVVSFSSLVHTVYPVPAAPNNTSNITASLGGGASGTASLPADVSQTLTVSAPVYNFPAIGSKQLTTIDFDPAATSTVPGLITYTSSNTAIASIVNNKVHLIAVSSTPVTITAFQNGINIGTGTLTAITAPSLTLTALGSKALTSIDFTPVTTTTMGAIPIAFTSSNTAVATIVNGNIHFVGIGTSTIKASQGGGAAGTTTLPADASQLLTVTAPTLTFAALGSKPFQIFDFPIPAAVSTLTNVPITYTSSNTAVATIVDNNIHFVGLGTTTIKASQGGGAAGTATLPADASQVLTITAPTLTAGTALGSKAYSTTDFAIPVATSSMGNLAPITYTSSDPTVATVVSTAGVYFIRYVGVGTCTITTSQTGYNAIPAPASLTQTLTVTPATIAITAIGAKTTGSADAALAATTSIVNTVIPVTFTSSDPTVATVLSGGILHIVGIGSTVITASQPTSANYAPAPATAALTVTAAIATTPVISFTSALGTKVFTNNGDITPPVTSTLTTTAVTFTSSNPLVATILNGLIHLSPPSIINGVAVYPNPNTTVITASQGGGPNGVPGVLPADVSQVLTVTPAVLTFPALGTQKFSTVDLNPGATSTYTIIAPDNTALPIIYTSSNTNVATIVNSQIHFVGLGTTVITASLGGVIVPDVSQTMTVVEPGIAFTTPASKVFSTTDVPPGATSTLTSPITYTSSDPTIVSIVNNNLHFNNTGVVTITASQAAVGNSGTPVSASQVLTVTPPVITFVAAARAFSLTDADPGATSTLTTLPNTSTPAPITYTSNNPTLVSIVNGKLHYNYPTPLGTSPTVTITASQIVPGFTIAPVSQTFNVTQTIIIQNPLSKTYGDADFSPGVSTIGYNVAYTSATTTVATISNGGLSVHIVAPGSSILTASQAGDASAVAAANATCTLNVAAAPLIITPKAVTRLYGVENPVQYPLIYTGFKSASGGVPLDDSTKFTTQPVLQSLVLNTNPTVNLLPQYGGIIPKTLPVGTYTLTYGGAASTFYTVLYGAGTLTINAAPQTLTFDPIPVKKYGTADFDPLARSTGDPIVYTSSDNTVATIVNGLVHIVGVGSTTITASISPTSLNYTGSASLSTLLTVVPGDQTITASNIPFLVKGAANYSVVASASSGLPVQLVSADPLVATIVGQTIKPLHIGTTIVTVKQAGNTLYNAAPDVVLYLKVVDPSGDPVQVHLALSPNGDGINDFLLIEGVQDFPGNHVSIINRNGIKVFSTSGYDNKGNVFVGKSNSGDQLPAGTYFYLVDFNVGDQKNHITGYFVLKY